VTDSEIRTKGSLCSGVGGLDVALPGALTWTAETDASASRILKREHPDVPNHEDITVPDFAGTHVDLLTSGDPCQSMSVAGRQKASEDERFLWPHVMNVIDRVRPRHVFLENVQNVQSVALIKGADDWRGRKGSALAMRLSDLRAAGYAARWTILGACAIGACHHRHRWFLRATYVGSNAPEAVKVENRCGAPRSGGRLLLPTPTVADARNTRNATAGRREGAAFNSGVTLSDIGHDFAAMTLLPTPTTRDGMGGPGRSEKRTGGDNLRTAVTLLPTPRATDGVNGGPNQRGRRGDLAMGSAVQAEHWGKFAQAIALHAGVFGTLPPEPTVPAPRGGRRLNPALSEWMMGYRAGYLTDELDRNDALRCAGNGVVPLVARTAWGVLA
jgi:DNA (cytosine-5)-methyltransferase 1